MPPHRDHIYGFYTISDTKRQRYSEIKSIEIYINMDESID